MRVLLVHNRYSSAVPSGENTVVEDEATWLAEAGVDVERFEVSNDDVRDAGAVAHIAAGALAVWSPPAARRVRERLRRARPDIVHVHNVFPLLSGSVVRAAARERLPVAWTVHNYRLTCVAGTHYRDGRLCQDCSHGVPRAAGVRHRCYAGSAMASAALTGGVLAFGAQVRHNVTAVPVSQYVAEWLVTRGFDRDRVRVKYGAVADPTVERAPASTSRTIVFVGRLGEEKGIRLLLDAFARCDVADAELLVIGNGDLEDEVHAAAARDPRVRGTGLLRRDDVLAAVARSRAVVLPSTWHEPFPRSAVEALSLGRPVITTGLGGLAETVDSTNGWLTGVDAANLSRAISAALAESPTAIDRRGEASRARYEAQFTPGATTSQLVEIYEQSIATAAR